MLTVSGVVGGLLLGGTTTAMTASSGEEAAAGSRADVVKLCVTKKGVVRAANARGRCPRKSKKRKINLKALQGAPGVPGAPGAPGGQGPQGPQGEQGEQGPGAVAIFETLPPSSTRFPLDPWIPGYSVVCWPSPGNIQLVAARSRMFGTITSSASPDPRYIQRRATAGFAATSDPERITVDLVVQQLDTGSSVQADLNLRRVAATGECELTGQVTPTS